MRELALVISLNGLGVMIGFIVVQIQLSKIAERIGDLFDR
jgi:hypothetical protein